MTDRRSAARQAREFFDDLWREGDPWELETSEFEQARYARQLALLGDRRYGSTLEIGCGAGSFTRLLAEVADRVVALDVAEPAVARAREAVTAPHVEFRLSDVMEFDLNEDGPWDLVVVSETIYYVGWLYSFFDVAWLASELFGATAPGGRLLLTNAQGDVDDYLVLPFVTRTYRDLFLNVGYALEREDVFEGEKNGVVIEVLMSLFSKGRPGS